MPLEKSYSEHIGLNRVSSEQLSLLQYLGSLTDVTVAASLALAEIKKQSGQSPADKCEALAACLPDYEEQAKQVCL